MYRQTNLDAIHVEQMITNSGGILMRSIETDEYEDDDNNDDNSNNIHINNQKGKDITTRRKKRKDIMVGLWAFFSFPDGEDDVVERPVGLPSPHFEPIIKMLKDGVTPEFRCLQVFLLLFFLLFMALLLFQFLILLSFSILIGRNVAHYFG